MLLPLHHGIPNPRPNRLEWQELPAVSSDKIHSLVLQQRINRCCKFFTVFGVSYNNHPNSCVWVRRSGTRCVFQKVIELPLIARCSRTDVIHQCQMVWFVERRDCECEIGEFALPIFLTAYLILSLCHTVGI